MHHVVVRNRVVVEMNQGLVVLNQVVMVVSHSVVSHSVRKKNHVDVPLNPGIDVVEHAVKVLYNPVIVAVLMTMMMMMMMDRWKLVDALLAFQELALVLMMTSKLNVFLVMAWQLNQTACPPLLQKLFRRE